MYLWRHVHMTSTQLRLPHTCCTVLPFYHHLGIDGQSTYSTLRSTAIQWTSAQHGHAMNIYAVLPFYKHLCNAAILQSTYLHTGRHSAQFYAVPPFYRYLCSAPFYTHLRGAAILHTYICTCSAASLHTSTECSHSTHIYRVPPFYTLLRSAAILHTSTECRHTSTECRHTSTECRHSTQIYTVPSFNTNLRSAAILHTCTEWRRFHNMFLCQ
jgi:hypothetical protein